jgi:fatty acid desaturase
MSAFPPAGLRLDGPLRRELPWLAIAVAFLVVLLHANAPEVWFWFVALVLLLLWRTLACRGRLQAAAAEALQRDEGADSSSSGRDTGAPG